MIWQTIQIHLKEFTFISVFIRLLMAALFGGIIGLERGRRRRAAGLRTHMLVCIGATLVMLTSQYIMLEYGVTDPTRMGAQVISGIGFLGVGTIIVDRQQQVRGLTTAAGLWACACMGLAIGIGFYSGAIISCGFILGTIIIMNKLERHVISRSRVMEIYSEFDSHIAINQFLNIAAQNNIKTIDIEIIQPRGHTGKDDKRAAAILTLQLPKKHLHTQIIDDLEAAPGLILIEELR